jgi:protein O-GlcNAc transferase
MNADQTIQSAFKFYQAGDLSHAESICLEILKEQPRNAEVLYFLGVIYLQSEKYDLTIKYIQKSLQFYADNVDAYHILGMAFQGKGQSDSAIHFYQKTIQRNPDYVEAYNNLGNALKEKGQFDDAIRYYQKALQLNPNLSVTYRNLGVVLQEKGNLDEAVGCYQKAVRIDADYAEAHYLLGYALMRQDRLQEAIESYRRSLQLNPYSAAILTNLGSALGYQGKLDEADVCLRRATQIDPNSFNARETRIMMMNYNARFDAQTIFSEHLQFAEKFAEPLSAMKVSPANIKSARRRLKIGYVSPDFRQHSVAYFIEPALAAHKKEHFEVFCYSIVAGEDEVTKRLQAYGDHWRDLAGVSDEKAADLIRGDGIDILVDLAGHSSNNRILLFARKPAPVQVSWIGYPATTGLSAMDYKIVDGYTDPGGMTEQFYTEKLLRLPECFLCYLPDKESPEVKELPASTEGCITFASFNNTAKLSPHIIGMWTRVMKAVPGSRLMLKAKSLSDRSTRDYLLDAVTQGGISEERIRLLPWEHSVKGHLEIYNCVDIGLDTFPYNGTTTTCEAIWMGVPVVTLAGNTHASRVGASLLSNAGLPELIAKTPDEYVDIAVKLAGDLERLRRRRDKMRKVMDRSPLTDTKRFIGDLENSFQSIWEKWCR